MHRSPLLLALALLLTAPACAGRGGGGGADDDDDDGGSGGSVAWIRTLDTFAEEDEVRHSVTSASYPNVCAEQRAEAALFESLNAAYDAGRDDVLEEFGDEEAPGAQEALCELERTWYGDLVDEDLPSLRPGAVVNSFSFYLADGDFGDDLPPGGYAYGDDTAGDYFWGGGQRIVNPSWLSDWDDVDCSDPDEVDQHWDGGEDLATYWELENGIVWISAPSDTVRGAVTEDVIEVDDESGATSAFSLDDEFPLCEIDRRD